MLISEIRAKNFQIFHEAYYSYFTKYSPPDMPSLKARFGRKAKRIAEKRNKAFMKFRKAPRRCYDELCKVQYKAKTRIGNWVEYPRDYCDFAEVPQRPKFEKSKQEIIRERNALVKTGRTIKVTSKRKLVKEDHDDDIFINTALDGKTDYIVTGDPHLLNFSNYKGIEIVTVAGMLKKRGY